MKSRQKPLKSRQKPLTVKKKKPLKPLKVKTKAVKKPLKAVKKPSKAVKGKPLKSRQKPLTGLENLGGKKASGESADYAEQNAKLDQVEKQLKAEKSADKEPVVKGIQQPRQPGPADKADDVIAFDENILDSPLIIDPIIYGGYALLDYGIKKVPRVRGLKPLNEKQKDSLERLLKKNLEKLKDKLPAMVAQYSEWFEAGFVIISIVVSNTEIEPSRTSAVRSEKIEVEVDGAK